MTQLETQFVDDIATSQRIISIVTIAFGVNFEQLQSKSRLKRFVHPRHICFFLLRKHTKLTLDRIGHLFGGRDHTTVRCGETSIGDQIGYDDKLAALIERFDEQIKSYDPSTCST